MLISKLKQLQLCYEHTNTVLAFATWDTRGQARSSGFPLSLPSPSRERTLPALALSSGSLSVPYRTPLFGWPTQAKRVHHRR
jgi:hypothetical protein